MRELLSTVLLVGLLIGCSSASDTSSKMDELKKEMRAQYGENKRITDGNYDKSLAVRCVNGTFVGIDSFAFCEIYP